MSDVAKRQERRLHISGSVALNGGDAAILAAELAMLRRIDPESTISISDSSPAAAARYFPGERFLPGAAPYSPARARARRLAGSAEHVSGGWWSWLSSDTPWIRESDCVFYTGGTSLVENYDIRPKLAEMEAAMRWDRRLALFPQSMGPFRTPEVRRRLGRVLGDAHLVLLRDRRSLEHVLDVGARADRCHVVPDIVFDLAKSADVRARSSEHVAQVAVSVREWPHFTRSSTATGMRRYTEAVVALVEHLVRERGAAVTFLSTCQGRPEYRYDDSQVAVDVASSLPSDVRKHVIVDREPRSPADLMRAYAQVDLLVATRLHAGILALCAGTPVLPIAYEFKTWEVFQDLGFADWVTDIEDITGEDLVRRLDQVLAELLDRGDALATAVQGMAERLKDVEGLIRRMLSS